MYILKMYSSYSDVVIQVLFPSQNVGSISRGATLPLDQCWDHFPEVVYVPLAEGRGHLCRPKISYPLQQGFFGGGLFNFVEVMLQLAPYIFNRVHVLWKWKECTCTLYYYSNTKTYIHHTCSTFK